MAEQDDRLTTDDLSGRTHQAQRTDAGEEHRLEDEDRTGAPDATGAPDQTPPADRPSAEARDEPLMAPADLEDFRGRWEQVQTRFVDEPRRAVEDADALVAEAMRQVAETFASERSKLEEQWDRAGEVDTEALRVTLQRYRSFFDRLLSA